MSASLRPAFAISRQPCSKIFFDFGQSYGAVSLYLPNTASFSSTFVLCPSRQRISRSTPVFSSAAAMARPKLLRASSANGLPFTPRITSLVRRTPSAGEPASTAVIRICRDAAVRSSWRRKIQPRAPVGPSSQSWLVVPLATVGKVRKRRLFRGARAPQAVSMHPSVNAPNRITALENRTTCTEPIPRIVFAFMVSFFDGRL